MSGFAPLEPRKKGNPFLGMSKRTPLRMFVKRTMRSSTTPADSTAEDEIIFFTSRFAVPVGTALGGGPLGVGGWEEGALQSKSWQVPTRRQMKHHRVRQLSW